MEAIIHVNMDNEVFGNMWGIELSRILKRLANDIQDETGEDFEINLRDINGNKVGIFRVKV